MQTHIIDAGYGWLSFLTDRTRNVPAFGKSLAKVDDDIADVIHAGTGRIDASSTASSLKIPARLETIGWVALIAGFLTSVIVTAWLEGRAESAQNILAAFQIAGVFAIGIGSLWKTAVQRRAGAARRKRTEVVSSRGAGRILALRLASGLLLLSAGALYALLFPLSAGTPSTTPTVDDIARMVVAMIPIVPAVSSWLLWRLSDRLAQPSADDVLQADPRRPILFLRSFRDDSIEVASERPTIVEQLNAFPIPVGMIGQTDRLEVAFGEEIRRHGPLIAIGSPSERLMAEGAARNYYADTQWQSAVAEFMDKARAIVIMASDTPGLTWELEQIFARGNDGKILVVLPKDDRGARWQAYKAALDRIDPHNSWPAKLPRNARTVCLARRSEPVVVCASRTTSTDYTRCVRYALYALMAPERLLPAT